jgi:hypothetical protein
MALKPQGNNILAGTSLAIAQIQSPGFVTGVTGWCIFQNGNAEFNNVTIRGGQVIGGTALYYSGTPAANNLVASVSGVAGTDPFGNDYLAGEASYHFTAAGGSSRAVAVSDSGITWYTAASGTLGPWVAGSSITSFSVVPGLFVSASTFKFTSTTDTNVYNIGQKSAPATATPQTINSMSAQTITGCTANVGAISYRIKAALQFAGNGAAGNPSFQIAGPATSAEWGNAVIWDSATGVNRNVVNTTALLWQGPTLSTNNWLVTIDAFATFSAAGALSLQAFTSVTADTYKIINAVLDIIPVS